MPFYTVDTTSATQFSYSLNDINGQILALTLTGFGSGFTYDAVTGDVTGGFVEDGELSVTFRFDLPGVGFVTNTFTYALLLEVDESVVSILNDPENGGAEIRELLDVEALDFDVITTSEILSLFTFDAAGVLIDGPNPLITYFNDTGPKLGTAIRDEIIFNNTGGRIDTLAGDDIVFVEAESGHVRATLRAGDDVFIGADAFSLFYGPEDLTAPTTWVNGGTGNDYLFGGRGEDFLRGFNDNDLLVGGDGADRITGGGGDDEIFAGRHDDVMFGGSGRDMIDGGLGNDVATGGIGRDVFIFDITVNADFLEPGSVSEIDVVTDFAAGLDTLHFRSGYDDVDRAQAFALFQANAVQSGTDTVFNYLDGTIILQNVDLTDITLDSFFDNPWQLDNEFDVYGRLDALLV
jgi:Ca2+-binding RTX toxin-like protein